MSGAVARCTLPRGLVSRRVSLARLRDAAAGAGAQHRTVLVEVDAEGHLASAGGDAALACVRARLAPHVAACEGVVSRAGGALRVRLTRAVPPLHEVRLWFDEELLAALDMPFLTLRNIRGRGEYECHECGARFEEPNPLKAHLFMRCAPASPARFWREVAARLAPAPAPAPPPPAGARLEALAAEWGRGRGGHACLYCGKLYSRKYGLKIHLRTHTGYRPLRCGYCARAFGDPSNLNKHVRLHAAAGGAARPRPRPRRRSCAAPAPPSPPRDTHRF